MGNQHNYQCKLLQKYQIICRTQSDDPIVKDKNNQAQYILKFRTFSSKEDSYAFRQYLQKKIRLSTKNIAKNSVITAQIFRGNSARLSEVILNQSNVIQVKQIYQRWQNNYCGKWYRVYALLEYSTRTFEDQVKERKQTQQYFTEDQIWSTLFSICCGILQLQYLGTSLVKLQLSRMFLDQEGSIKLFDSYLIDQFYLPIQNSVVGFNERRVKIQNSVALVILQIGLLRTEAELDEKSMDLLGSIYSRPLCSVISSMLEGKLELRALVQICMNFLKIQQQLANVPKKYEKQKKGIRISENYVNQMKGKIDKIQKKQTIEPKEKENLLSNTYHFVKSKYSRRHRKDQKSSLKLISHSKSQKRFSYNMSDFSEKRKKSTISLDYKQCTRMSSLLQSPHLQGLYSPSNEAVKFKKSQTFQDMVTRDILARRTFDIQDSNRINNALQDYQSQKSRSSNLIQDYHTFGRKQRVKTDFLKEVKQTQRIFSFKNSENKQVEGQFGQTAYFKRQKGIKTCANIKKKLKFKYENQIEQTKLSQIDMVELEERLSQILIDNNGSQQKLSCLNDVSNHKFPKKTSFIKKKAPQVLDIDTKKFSRQLFSSNRCEQNTMQIKHQNNAQEQINQSQIQIPNELLSISPVGNQKDWQETSRNNFSPPQFLDMIFQQQLQIQKGNQQTKRVVFQGSNKTIVQVSQRYESQFTTDQKREQSANRSGRQMHMIQNFQKNEKSLSQSKASNYSQMKLQKIKELFGSTQTLKTQQNKNNGISSRITVKKQYCSSFLEGMGLQDVETLNVKNGFEKVNFEDGAYYQGQWLNNQMHGYGKLYYPSRKLAYCGFWANNMFEGKGILINDDQKGVQIEQIDYKNMSNLEGKWYKYEGGFKGDLIHGEGVLTFRDGSKIKGEWMANKLEGVAAFQVPNVKKVIGYYEGNILVKVYQELTF